MVALDSRGTPDPPLELAAETLVRLRDTLAARFRGGVDANSDLATALRAAAVEAREIGLRPEQLLLVLKRLGDDVERCEVRTIRLGSEE